MDDKLTAIKIRQNDGTYSDQIPVSVLIDNIDWDDNYTLKNILGNINIQEKGNIQYQLNQLWNTKISTADLSKYIFDNLEQDISNWLDTNINTDGPIVIDKSLSVENAAADAKAVSDIFSTKADLNQVIAKTTGEIKWQIPQGSVQKDNYTYSIFGNRITLNGYVSGASIVRFFIYESQLSSVTGNPTYNSSSSKHYLNPITAFTVGHRIRGEIKLISGTYRTGTLQELQNQQEEYALAPKKPYIDLRDINHYSGADWMLGEINGYQRILDFQPQMIVFGAYRGLYDNAVFEFSITDLDIKNNLYFKSEMDQIVAKTIGEIRWSIPQGVFKRDFTSFSGDSITLSKNTIIMNGERSGTKSLNIMINNIFNYTNGVPTYTAYSNIYFDPITSFIIGHKIKVKIKLLSGDYTLSNNNNAIYLDLRDIENNFLSPFYDQEEKTINFQPQMIAICFPPGTYNNAIFEFSIIDMDSIGEKLNRLQSLNN